MQPMKFYIRTFGCTFNQADSEKIEAILKQNGLDPTDESNADLIIINTCAVKQTTQSKILSFIHQISNNYPQKMLVICGCLPQIDAKINQTIKDYIGNRGLIVCPKDIGKITSEIQRKFSFLNNGLTEYFEQDKSLIFPIVKKNNVSGILQISEGCNMRCTYCCTWMARGNLVNYDPNIILRQIQYFLQNGIKEIFITSQDIGTFNYQGIKLPDLLSMIAQIPSNFRIRLGMLNPIYLDIFFDEFLKIFEDKRFYRFLHLPIQSGSPQILKLMGRSLDFKKFTNQIYKIRSFDPLFAFSTDIITGFPTETEDDHAKTCSFIQEWQPDVLNISKYSNRPNTIAKTMKQIPSEIIKKRSTELTDLYNRYIEKKNQKWIGYVGEILINETHFDKEWAYMGRNLYYRPILCKMGKVGAIEHIKVTGSLGHSLTSEII